MKLELNILLLLSFFILGITVPTASYAVHPSNPSKKSVQKKAKKQQKLLKKIKKFQAKIAHQKANGKKGIFWLKALFIYLLVICIFCIIATVAFFIKHFSRSKEERAEDRHDYTVVVGLAALISIFGTIFSAKKLKKLKQRTSDEE